jgi:hypothetical protein
MILRTRQRSRPGNRAVQLPPRAGSELSHRDETGFQDYTLMLFCILHLYSLTRGRRNTHIHSLQGISEHSHLLQRKFQQETVFHVLPDKPRRRTVASVREVAKNVAVRGCVRWPTWPTSYICHLPSARLARIGIEVE